MKTMRILSVLLVVAVMGLAQPHMPTFAQAAPDACALFSSLSGVYYGNFRGVSGTAQPGDVFTIVGTPSEEQQQIGANITGYDWNIILAGPALATAPNQITLTYTVPASGLPAGAGGVGITTQTSPGESSFSVTASCSRATPEEEEAVPGCDLLPLTANAVVGTFVSDAILYAEPDVSTSPQLTLPAGKTAWVLGVDKSDKYYKIKWVCDYLWVKKATMGPNFDEVWQGHLLPTDIVE